MPQITLMQFDGGDIQVILEYNVLSTERRPDPETGGTYLYEVREPTAIWVNVSKVARRINVKTDKENVLSEILQPGTSRQVPIAPSRRGKSISIERIR